MGADGGIPSKGETPSGRGEGPITVEEGDFEERVLRADVPVILVFTAQWCAPCRWLTPYLDEIVRTAGGRILVYQLDTDRAPATSKRYRVASVPTVLLLRSGEEIERSIGVEPDRLRGWAAGVLAEDGGRDGRR